MWNQIQVVCLISFLNFKFVFLCFLFVVFDNAEPLQLQVKTANATDSDHKILYISHAHESAHDISLQIESSVISPRSSPTVSQRLHTLVEEQQNRQFFTIAMQFMSQMMQSMKIEDCEKWMRLHVDEWNR